MLSLDPVNVHASNPHTVAVALLVQGCSLEGEEEIETHY